MANQPRDLTQALLETAERMRRVGMVSDDTYQKIAVRHMGSAALPVEIPNRTTHKAMVDLEAGKGKKFDSSDALFKDLGTRFCAY